VREVDLFLEAEHHDWIERTDRFVHERLEPAGIDEAAPGASRRVLDLLAAAGLLDAIVPAAHGGAHERLDLRTICCVRERLARASGLADLMFVMQGLGSSALLHGGNATLRDDLLPGLRRGEQVAAVAMTEPEAGSDLGAIRVTARRDGDGYVLDGVKQYISNGGEATFFTVLARTGPVEERHRALTFFLVEADRDGIAVEPIPLLSPHPVSRVTLDGCRVPAGNLLGEQDRGIDLALGALNFFRASVGAAAVGFARRALEASLEHAGRREQFGRPIAAFQGVQHQLADMAVQVDAARLLVLRAAASRDAGEDRPLLASMAKLFATEAAGRVVDTAVQIHGASGLVAGSVVEKLYREVRALRVYEGTSEIQRNLIAREILQA
jgi:acyl-CoA dehydrogenase